jgi:translation initiation factor 5
MSGMLNIGGENAGDAFYRYKMPKLQCKIEGRGNGIKTNVVNNVDIAKALERPPEYVIKFFGTELGAQTKFDKKSGTSIVNGAHDQKKLSEILESFIKKYVQCYGCGNPETVVKIKKENIYLKCKACGHVSSVDPGYKLNTFIIKNPPENKLSKAEKKVKKAEKERLKGLETESSAVSVASSKDEKKKKKKSKKSKDGEDSLQAEDSATTVENVVESDVEEPEEGEDDDDEVVWMTDTSDAAMKKRAEEQLSGATAKMVTQGNLEADRAAKKKEKEEKKKLEEETKSLNIGEDTDQDPLDVLNAAVAKSPIDMDAIRNAFVQVPGNMPSKVVALYTSLFESFVLGKESKSLHKEFESKATILHEFASDPASQLAQLMAFEVLISQGLSAGTSPKLQREVPLILKFLFEEDIIDEDIIIGWHHKAGASSVLGVSSEHAKDIRSAAKPVVVWLEEAETDESSDEDSEEDQDIDDI